MKPRLGLSVAAVLTLTCSSGLAAERNESALAESDLELPIRAGVEAWIGIPDGWTAKSVTEHCHGGNRLIHMQVRNEKSATEMREAAMALPNLIIIDSLFRPSIALRGKPQRNCHG